MPFEHDTKSIVKTIARNDITKNRIKKVFSIITISLATTLLMALAMFESGYEISKDRLAAGQPQIIFSEVSDQQVSLLRSDEHIETIVVTDAKNGYDAQVTIIDAAKMTQYGFTTVVNKIASQYNIRRVITNELFMDSLPDGGLLNQKNAIIVAISFFVIFISALVIYNIFYLSITNQVQQFGQLRTIGMTQKQIKKVIRYERKHLCRISIPVGLLIGGFIGYLLQPNGWDWVCAIILSVLIALIITFVVKISLSKPAKLASSISPISSSKYIGGMNNYSTPHKLKRKLSPLGLSMISIIANWKKEIVSLLSLGLCGLLFVLAATYSASIDVEAIVEKEIYQYGQFIIDTTEEYNQIPEKLDSLLQNIKLIPGVNTVKQIMETDIEWSTINTIGDDQLSIITASDFSTIQSFIQEGETDYQTMVNSKEVLVVSGLDDISIGSTVVFSFGDGVDPTYTVGAILDSNIYSNTAIYGGWFLIPEELIPGSSGNFTVSVTLVVAADNTALKDVETSLKVLLDDFGGLSFTTMQEAVAARNVTVKQVSMAIISITLLLLFFSIITFTSTIITSIATRKREYAMLQSIGMQRKQVEVMALGESILLAVGSLLITLFLGIIGGQIMIRAMNDMGIFYLSYTFPLRLYAIYCLSTLFTIMLITFSAFRAMQKVSLVDRLRITE
ncbi:MAG: FtsX-like permease family protein [Lachnospiraceae bacterium]|nr:FtsX-like permease family protein [Lachnospiraceae bacterium]